MEINVFKPMRVNVKTLKIHCKVSDRFSYSLEDISGNQLFDQCDDYVPDIMPGEHYGDYIILDIDIDTGQITNWVKPDAERIEQIVKAEPDSE